MHGRSLAEFGHLSGRVRLPTGHLTVCGCVAIRGGDESSDWLDFYVPLGALDKAGVAYWDGRPFFRSDVMDEWLAAIGTETFTSTSFSLGGIGFEVSGCTDASAPAGSRRRGTSGTCFREAASCTTAPPTPEPWRPVGKRLRPS
ncbi:hypothetical protein ACFW2K_20615 [Streptomyces nigra]|uniref:hypothetical protein n=1 Tax=Streptomyces nigra TaxID=1827580 RepID=UPI0036BE3E06